jgi:type III pantothenate kinase
VPLLAIDQGNQRTKCGLFAGDMLLTSWVVPTNKQASFETLAALLPSSPTDLHLGLSTVVPELLPAWRQMTELAGIPLTVITGTTPTPLRNAYATPETLGSDRLMAAVAAAHLIGNPVIPISLGTATVVDAVSADDCYLGGMIAPGIGMDIDGLARAASALPPAIWNVPVTAIGRTSVDALTHGLFYHTLGGLQAMIAAVRGELGTPAPLALTGGWAETIAPHLDGVILCDPLLILRGIARTLSA